jgi:hypothetical protein
MSEQGAVSVVVACIGAFASIVVAWLTTRAKSEVELTPRGNVSPGGLELPRGVVAGLISAGVLYCIGFLYVFAAIFFVFAQYRNSNSAFLMLCFAMPFLIAAFFVHRRSRRP